MRHLLEAATLALISTTALAQSPTAAPQPTSVRICVANFKTEMKQATDTLALRDRLAAYLKSGILAKNHKADILTINADSDEKATAELAASRCDFAIYSRTIVGRLGAERPGVERGKVPEIGPTKKKSDNTGTLVPGVQFTSVRVSSGIPVLIDRVFLDRAYKDEEDLWMLLRTEQERIDAALEKRIAPAPAKPEAN